MRQATPHGGDANPLPPTRHIGVPVFAPRNRDDNEEEPYSAATAWAAGHGSTVTRRMWRRWPG